MLASVFSKENQEGGVGSFLNIMDQFCSNVPPVNVDQHVRQTFVEYCKFESPAVLDFKKNLSLTSENVKRITAGQPTCFEVSNAGIILYQQYKSLNDSAQKRELLVKWNTMVNKTVFFFTQSYNILLNNLFEMNSMFFPVYYF